jgi:hypothetical protein
MNRRYTIGCSRGAERKTLTTLNFAGERIMDRKRHHLCGRQAKSMRKIYTEKPL